MYKRQHKVLTGLAPLRPTPLASTRAWGGGRQDLRPSHREMCIRDRLYTADSELTYEDGVEIPEGALKGVHQSEKQA